MTGVCRKVWSITLCTVYWKGVIKYPLLREIMIFFHSKLFKSSIFTQFLQISSNEKKSMDLNWIIFNWISVCLAAWCRVWHLTSRNLEVTLISKFQLAVMLNSVEIWRKFRKSNKVEKLPILISSSTLSLKVWREKRKNERKKEGKEERKRDNVEKQKERLLSTKRKSEVEIE